MSFNLNEKSGISQDVPTPGLLLQVAKNRGETLAVFLERIREGYRIEEGVPMTYAGRLDPMAEGLMLVLTGEKCKEKDIYTGMEKTYVFEVLCGVSTDTYDTLGNIVDSGPFRFDLERIEGVLQRIQQQTLFPYPPYSSKTVGGTPLFAHARAGTLPTEMPTKEGNILSASLDSIRSESFSDIVTEIIVDIEKVSGDFRQSEIIDGWNVLQEKYIAETCTILTCTATVTSGVYIRTIAHEIGKLLGVPTLAYSIKRISIGGYK